MTPRLSYSELTAALMCENESSARRRSDVQSELEESGQKCTAADGGVCYCVSVSVIASGNQHAEIFIFASYAQVLGFVEQEMEGANPIRLLESLNQFAAALVSSINAVIVTASRSLRV